MPELKEVVAEITPEAYKSNPEFYKFLLDERKDGREDSLARRSGAWATGFAIPIITLAFTFIGTEIQRNETSRQQSAQREETARQQTAQAAETERQRTFQREETIRKENEEATKRHIDNARLALEMYTKNLTLFDPKNSDAPIHIKMMAIISDNSDLKRLFDEMWAERMRDKIAQGSTPAEAAASLPDRIITTGSESNFASFVGYVEALPDNADRGRAVVAALRQLKMKVDGVDTKVRQVPEKNEIRYYRSGQAEIAGRLAEELKKITGETFAPRDLNRPGLPDGILEIWIGRSPAG